MVSHVFGPVLSRRLGASLGIDLLPFKTCSYDCVYCECGATTDRTDRRSLFFPEQEIIRQLDCVLSECPVLDYITFAGSGEPTLSLSIGRMIAHLKAAHPHYRVAVLTNGSLLSRNDVIDDLLEADLVIPTLTTVHQHTFEEIHRARGLSIARIIEGLVTFRQQFSGEFWLEVFLVPPLNTTKNELGPLREAISSIGPDRVQLNTLDRPGAEPWVTALTWDELDSIAAFMSDKGLKVEIIGYTKNHSSRAMLQGDLQKHINEIIRRRPCTPEELAVLTGLHISQVTKYLARQFAVGKVIATHEERGLFFRSCHQTEGDAE